MCRWRAINRWKALNKGYDFASDLTSIEGLHTKLCASKIAGVPILGISGLPSPRQNDIWVLALWLGIDNTLKGKVVASPKSWPW